MTEWLQIQQEKARLAAREALLLAGALDNALAEAELSASNSRESEIPVRSVVAEYSAAGRISSRTMECMMWDAHSLVTRFPVTFQSLESGRISPTHARIIADAGFRIGDEEKRFEYELAAVNYAEGESPNRIRSVVRMLAAKHGGVTEEERRKNAHESRCVWVQDFDDGNSQLSVRGPSVLIHAAFDRLTQLGRVARGSDAAVDDQTLIPAQGASAGTDAPGEDERTMDQVRADVFLDLLLAADATTVPSAGVEAIRANIQVTIPAAVLAGSSDAPADLYGCGPVDADLARELAGLAPGWDRLYLEAYSGLVTATDRYRPTAEMRRHLRARDGRCRFPGCGAAAWRCDLDHNQEHSRGGPTACGNLSHLCRRHHSLKHPDVAPEYWWTARQLSRGKVEWTSPNGWVFVDHPPPRVQFT